MPIGGCNPTTWPILQTRPGRQSRRRLDLVPDLGVLVRRVGRVVGVLVRLLRLCPHPRGHRLRLNQGRHTLIDS